MDNFKMSDMMAEHLEMNEVEMLAIDECIPVKNFEKGSVLLREGQVARDCYFNLKGCVRHYYIIDGEEKTTAFYTEGDSIAPLSSYINKTPANHYLECVEDCTLAILNYDKEIELNERVKGFESLCRLSMEADFGNHQQQLAKFITKSPEERYLDLLENRPDLLNRVPQYHLASYLGVKPESLSRIRKRVSGKK